MSGMPPSPPAVDAPWNLPAPAAGAAWGPSAPASGRSGDTPSGGASWRTRFSGSGSSPATARARVRVPWPPGLVAILRTAALIAALAAVGIVHVWSHTRVTTAGYRLGELQRTQDALRAQRDRLEVEVATLRAPGRLEEFARTRLKMAPPAPGAVVAARPPPTSATPAKTAGGEARPRAVTGPLVATAQAR